MAFAERAQDPTPPASAGRSSRQRRHSRSAPYPVAVRPLPRESSLHPEVELRDERPLSQDCLLHERNSLRQGLLHQHECPLIEESKFEEGTPLHEEAPQHKDSSLPPQMMAHQETSVPQGRLQLQGVSPQERLLREDHLLRDEPLLIAERIECEEPPQIEDAMMNADLLQERSLSQERLVHQEKLQHRRNVVHEQITVQEEDSAREEGFLDDEGFLHDENSLRGQSLLPQARLPPLESQVNHQREGNLPGEESLPYGDTPLREVRLPRRQSVLSEGTSLCQERLQSQPSLLPANVLRSPTRVCSQEHLVDSTQQNLYQLVVRLIVNATIGQRDTSGNTLAGIIVSGGSFTEILQKLWDQFVPRIKCRAVKTDDVWSTQIPDIAEWSKVMQLKVKKHIVDTAKSEQAWNRWLVKTRGKTATLLIYEFGVAMTRAQDLSAFKEACIRPEQTDRAGATAEVSLPEVVASLQEEWGTTFSGEAVVWRMWANHITRNLNRSTWEAAVELPPPDHVAHLLQLASSTMDRHVANLARSANVALDCVNGSLADYEDLRHDWEEFGQHLGRHRQNLEKRRRIIEGFIRDVAPPSPSTVPDPLIELENVEDVDHAV